MKKRRIPRSDHSGSVDGWAVMSTLIGGFVVWGGVGWGLDHWWGTRFATPVGVLLGMALGIYAVVARYGLATAPGRQQTGQRAPEPPADPESHDNRESPSATGARKEY
jgi:F0F1-type ATP synthase assembly protein I